jgi:hypothetical protein
LAASSSKSKSSTSVKKPYTKPTVFAEADRIIRGLKLERAKHDLAIANKRLGMTNITPPATTQEATAATKLVTKSKK